jgi:hypothetical protein
MLAAWLGTCERLHKRNDSIARQDPKIEISPLQQERGQWKVVPSDKLTLTISAPGAQSVRILDQPEGVEEQIELKSLIAPSNPTTGTFSTELSLPMDFAGDVWAEAHYLDGTTKKTEPFAIAVEIASETPGTLSTGAGRSTGGSLGTDESARSDKFTGGHIEKTQLKPGDSNIRITVNVPAFQLTLWQNGKEVKAYDIGIGRKNFPLPIGEREANAIIFNPRWIPPDSAWVRRTAGVEPYERIEPGDARNPLGKIKISLGGGYLIHEAAKPSDIGHLISHGCVRMLTEDLFDLTDKIIAAYGLPISPQQLAHAKESTDRLPMKLDSPLLVDINYDPQVVEGGVLHLYPDVYGRGAFSVESLRAELQGSGVEAARLEEKTLKELIERVSPGEQLLIRVRDIEAGRFSAGQTQPVVKSPGARRIGRA